MKPISHKVKKKVECSRRPREHPFIQQKIPGWQPNMSINDVLLYFMIAGAIFIVLGVFFLQASSDLTEYKLDYTDCTSENGVKCRDLRRSLTSMNVPCICSFEITLPLIDGNVFFFYGLSQFNQNHRKYGWSRSDPQLNGERVPEKRQVSDCLPYDGIYVNGTWKSYAPCGMIANSMFNDTFIMTSVNGSVIPASRSGIAWPSDAKTKFMNPVSDTCASNDEECKNNLSIAFEPYTKPSWWATDVQDLGNTDEEGHGYKNEALMVWMQVAAFPNFRKKYAKVKEGLPLEGKYNLTINYNYPVSYNVVEGRKTFIVSNTGWMGQKNEFLGVAYILFGVVFTLISITSGLLQYSAIKKVVSVSSFPIANRPAYSQHVSSTF